MKISVLMGSPRKKGNTAQCLEPFCDELKKLGHEYTVHWLYDKKIDPCFACRACQKDWTTFSCVRKDDLKPIADDVFASDLIVLATPIYSWYCPGPMKNVLDRFVYGFNKYYGEKLGPSIWAGKKVTLLVSLIIFRGRQKRAADVLARVDLLTGLPNRRAYEEKLREIQQNPPTHLMAVALDLNGLKKANDTRGHQAGDELLRAVGDCFRKTCGEAAYQEYTCLGYRVGGDEFVCLLYMDEKTFESFSDSFQKNVSQWKGKRNDCLSIAQGYAGWYEFPGVPVTELLRVADNRMYEDKERYHRERGRR